MSTKRNQNLDDNEKISIGICAYNEESNIGALLNNLINEQNLCKDDEIIVVSSGSTDSTNNIVKNFCEKDTRINLIVQEKRMGKASAVNEILTRYSNNFICLIPADVIPDPFSVSRLIERISENPKIGVVGGNPIPINSGKGISVYFAQLMWRLHNRTLKFLNDLSLSTHASGEFMVARRAAINKLPLDIINDDAYIAVEAMKKGFLVKFCEDAKVKIKAPTNIVDFIRQRRRVVYGHHRVKQRTGFHPRTLESMAAYDFKKTLHIIKEELIEYPRSFFQLSIMICVEALINIIALFDLNLKKDHTLWDVVGSTKKI